jgi:hypothetical protein
MFLEKLISFLLWNPKTVYGVCKSLPLDTVLTRMNAAQNLIPVSLKIY